MLAMVDPTEGRTLVEEAQSACGLRGGSFRYPGAVKRWYRQWGRYTYIVTSVLYLHSEHVKWSLAGRAWAIVM
jgi:hypothetical protein